MLSTESNVPTILEFVNEGINSASKEDVPLKLVDHSFDDEWLYIMVSPARAGIRASDYAEWMSKIEKELRNKGFENVLLVPTLENI